MNRTDAGFSLLECVVAMALTLLVAAAGFAVANASTTTGRAQPDAIETQERLRLVRDVLFSALLRAGAGMSSTSARGPLNVTIAPVIPRKVGAQSPDPVLSARSDAVTVIYVPQTLAQSASTGPVSVATGLDVATQPNCPAGQAACGFQVGMTALVFDRTAHFDLFSILQVPGSTLQLKAHGAGSGYPYSSGAAATEAESHTYYFDPAASQLRQYDGDQTDVPVADSIAGVTFEYFGDANPPLNPRPPAGTANCLYDAAGNLVPMPVLSGAAGGLVPLPLAMFTDGPWCGSGATRFDADLLRLRAVRVTVRAQAVETSLGTSRESLRHLPDLVTTFVVLPKNLGGGR